MSETYRPITRADLDLFVQRVRTAWDQAFAEPNRRCGFHLHVCWCGAPTWQQPAPCCGYYPMYGRSGSSMKEGEMTRERYARMVRARGNVAAWYFANHRSVVAYRTQPFYREQIDRLAAEALTWTDVPGPEALYDLLNPAPDGDGTAHDTTAENEGRGSEPDPVQLGTGGRAPQTTHTGDSIMSTTTETRTISPKDPNAPASEATHALIARFEMPFSAEELTQDQASSLIQSFFEANPEAKARYEAEREARRKAAFRRQIEQYHQAAVRRLEGTGKAPASEAQVAGMLRRAFERPQDDHLRRRMLSALTGGPSAAQANVLIRMADGTFVENPAS